MVSATTLGEVDDGEDPMYARVWPSGSEAYSLGHKYDMANHICYLHEYHPNSYCSIPLLLPCVYTLSKSRYHPSPVNFALIHQGTYLKEGAFASPTKISSHIPHTPINIKTATHLICQLTRINFRILHRSAIHRISSSIFYPE